MATGVVCSRNRRERKVGSAEEERGGQTTHGVVGRKEKEGGSERKIPGGVWCCIDNNWIGRGHSGSSNARGSREGMWGPNFTFAWARRRGRHRPTNHINTVEAPTPDRVERVTQEGQSNEVVNWPNHPNWGFPNHVHIILLQYTNPQNFFGM